MEQHGKMLQPIRLPFQGSTPGNDRETMYIRGSLRRKRQEGYIQRRKRERRLRRLNEKQRAEQAGSMTGHELDQKIEVAKQLLNQLEELGKEFDLKETIKEVHKCIDIYTKERDQRKEAGTWKEWGV